MDIGTIILLALAGLFILALGRSFVIICWPDSAVGTWLELNAGGASELGMVEACTGDDAGEGGDGGGDGGGD